MSKIVELYQQMQQIFHADHSLELKVNQQLSAFVNKAFNQSMLSDEGYCFKFSPPYSQVLALYKMVGFDQKQEVFPAFRKDWGSGAMSNQMHSDPYYQILLLFAYYGILEKKDYFYKNAMMCIFMKIWNGRKVRYIKFCDKKIMKYVVTHMVTKKHAVSKYDAPINLLYDYHIPKLFKKYAPEIKRNPIKLKRLFEQMYSRINQHFMFNPRRNLVTGKNEAQGGLLPLYMKAQKEGMSVSTPNIGMGDDEAGFDEYSTVHIRDQITNDVTDYITMNPNPMYPDTLIKSFNRQFRIKEITIKSILQSMHSNRYQDIIHDLISIILSRTNVSDKIDVCKTTYRDVVKKTIISSKNNPDTRKIQKLCDILLTKIFDNNLKDTQGKPLTKVYNKYSDVTKIQIRNVLIYGIVFNINKAVCRN